MPAELLGVSSGLGYAIKDTRETLAYDHLTAMVVVIGIIGFTLDTIVGVLVKKYSWQKNVSPEPKEAEPDGVIEMK